MEPKKLCGRWRFLRKHKRGPQGRADTLWVALVEKAEQLGMFIDVSHLNDEGFWDLMDIASKR